MKPLRPFLLNEQISLAARRIAHETILTCKGKMLPNLDAHHTPKCNHLKREIEELVLGVKVASLQPAPRNEPPPPFELSELSDAP